MYRLHSNTVAHRLARSVSSMRNTRSSPLNVHSQKTTSNARPPRKGLIARLLQYRLMIWLAANAMPLATYQLLLETGCTAAFGWLLLHQWATPADLNAWLHQWHYPFTSLIDWEGGHHETGLAVAGLHVDAATLTAVHTGHNIANGLLPLQVVFLALTYPAVARLSAAAKGPLMVKWEQLLQWGKTRFSNGVAKKPPSTPTTNPFGKPNRRRIEMKRY